MIFYSTLKDLDSLASSLICNFPQNSVILLRGDLASGKTTLIKHILKTLKIPLEATSPTFSLQNLYHSQTHFIYHYDFYRKDLQEILELGILEELEKEGWHFIEWGNQNLEKFLKESGLKVVIITIEKLQGKRAYRIEQ